MATLSATGLLALCLLGVSSAASLRPPGSLDRSFGTKGVVSHDVGGYAAISGIAAQADGKIVVGGSGLLARYLPDGTIDPSFGTGGYVQVPSPTYFALQPDGKIVVVGGYDASGSNPGGLMVTRYNADGSVDTSFGTDGVTTTPLGDPPSPGVIVYAGANALTVLPSGDILVAGGAGSEDLISGDTISSESVVARYTAGGALDPAFGDAGIAGAGSDYYRGIVVLPSGTIVESGSYCECAHDTYLSGISLAGFRPDGSVDPRFGSIEMGHDMNHEYFGGFPVVQHGKLVVVGSVILRFKANGQIDRTFGRRAWPLGVSDAVAQSNGKILIGTGIGVARLMPNGQLDKGFGKNGIVTLRSSVSSLALQADKKILVGGGSGPSWRLTRLLGAPGP
jgi:uncharacterized delta-60 repeat protein